MDDRPQDPPEKSFSKPPIDPGALLDRLIADTPGATKRLPQERMVHTIHADLAAGHHSAIQAGTGTGKSFGYLVGALAAGRTVVVSTSTKMLGEQLVGKDIPRVAAAAEALGRPVTAALLKGRSNYLCGQKIDDELRAAGTLLSTDTADVANAVKDLLAWARTTSTGDRAEAPTCSDRAWSRLSTDSTSCPGASACPFSDGCFAEQAKARAAAADVTVINHSLLAHMMELAAMGARTPLGGFDVLVADEAHDLEPALTKAWSVEVSPARITRTFDAARGRLGPTSKDAVDRGVAAAEVLNQALAALPPGELRSLPETVAGPMDTVIASLRTLASATREREMALTDAKAKAGWRMLTNRLRNTATEVHDTLTIDRETHVQWVETQQERSTLNTAPLTIDTVFPRMLESCGWELVLSSATLTVGGSFDPVTKALGLDAHGTDVGSPFDYPRQAMVFVPPADFPSPAGSAESRMPHTRAVQECLAQLIDAAGGRTLGLFTTAKAAKDAATAMREQFPHLTILATGDAPMGQLVTQFRDEETSVLLGTLGLWQGVDVPGPSCLVTLIDKIPFPMFNDPLMSARKRKVDETGGRGFDEVLVTHAAITLAQGAGREIRTSSDRGVIAVMDPRLRTKYYGGVLMRSLPPGRRWDDLGTVTSALRRLTAAPAAA